jgi:hypothetical protein
MFLVNLMTVCFHLKDNPVNARKKINVEDYENHEQDRQCTNNVNTEARWYTHSCRGKLIP